MACASSFISLVGLFLLASIERASGLPTNMKAEDNGEGLTEKERVHIREVIRLALEEFKDEDVLHVLKESLELRFKICFSPFPSSPVSLEKWSDSNGIMEDEEFTPEQKKGLRELLLECLEHIDEQEMLNFLKHSIEFRVQFCPWPGEFLNQGPPPGPGPGPHTTARSTERSIPNSSAKPTRARASPSLSPTANTAGPITEAPTTMGVVKEATNPTLEYVAANTPHLSEEDAPLEISRRDEMTLSGRDEPSQAQIIESDASVELDKATKKLATHPELQSRYRGIVKKDTTAKLSKRVSKRLDPPDAKLSLTDLVSDEELTRSLVSETDPSETQKPERSNDRSVVSAPKEVTNVAKLVTKSLRASDSKPSLSDLVSDKELTGSLVSEPRPSKTEETASNDQTIIGSPKEVAPHEVMATNSDKGEFASVTRIDYDSLAHDDEPGVVQVDLGLIAESNEELS